MINNTTVHIKWRSKPAKFRQFLRTAGKTRGTKNNTPKVWIAGRGLVEVAKGNGSVENKSIEEGE